MLLFTLRFRVQIPGGALAWNNAKKCASKGSSSPRCAICSIHKAKPSSGLWQWLLSHEAKVMPPSTTNVKPIRLSTSGPLHPFKPPPSMYALFWPLAWSTLLPSPPHVIGRPFPLPLGRQSPLINRIFPHWPLTSLILATPTAPQPSINNPVPIQMSSFTCSNPSSILSVQDLNKLSTYHRFMCYINLQDYAPKKTLLLADHKPMNHAFPGTEKKIGQLPFMNCILINRNNMRIYCLKEE